MPVYRYKRTGLDIAKVKAQVPVADAPSVSAGSIGPTQLWDITAPATSLDDLTAFMAAQGWTYDSTDPSETPAEQSAGDQDHGGLTGLGDDDHSQYHNNTRGDARYYQKTEWSNKAQLDLVTDGDHDVRTDNPHSVTAAQAGAASSTHASTHGPSQSDALKLDDLAEPDDNTDLNASTSKHGLLLKLGGGTTNFLRADGSWAAPAGGVFGTEYDYAEKTTLQTTTSTSWQEYLSLTTGSLPAGTYRIGWMFVWNYSDPNDEWMARLQVDDTTDLINPGDGTYPYQRHEIADGGIDQRYITSGFRHVTLGAGTHDIDIDFRSDETADTARMYHGQIEIWRVS